MALKYARENSNVVKVVLAAEWIFCFLDSVEWKLYDDSGKEIFMKEKERPEYLSKGLKEVILELRAMKKEVVFVLGIPIIEALDPGAMRVRQLGLIVPHIRTARRADVMPQVQQVNDDLRRLLKHLEVKLIDPADCIFENN